MSVENFEFISTSDLVDFTKCGTFDHKTDKQRPMLVTFSHSVSLLVIKIGKTSNALFRKIFQKESFPLPLKKICSKMFLKVCMETLGTETNFSKISYYGLVTSLL